MREDARLGLIAVIGALVLFAWDRGGEQLARMGDVVGADAAGWLGSPPQAAHRPSAAWPFGASGKLR
jgi:hypothetical protein